MEASDSEMEGDTNTKRHPGECLFVTLIGGE